MSQRAVGSGTSIGLDIGSSAVRAAELGRRGLRLVRFAQIGLPVGAVVDGEIQDPGAVVVALRRLWSEGGFTSRNVVACLSGQRVIVRQAEVPAMSEGDLRSAIRYQAADLIPIPVDLAILDFAILPAEFAPPSEPGLMRILLGAAQRTVVEGQLSVLRDASLKPVAIDPSPMAAARVARRAGLGGIDSAVVDIGAELTVVVARHGEMLRFSRILNAGGGDLTSRVAERLGVETAAAESLKRHAALTGGGPGYLDVEDIDPIVTEIESSLSFFASQIDSGQLDDVLVTGGPSRSPELVQALTRRLPVPVAPMSALSGIELGAEIDEQTASLASSSALLAIGAAQWAFDSPSQRLSLLPHELAAAAAFRKQAAVAGVGVLALAALLGAASYHQGSQVSQARHQAVAASATNAQIQSQISALAPISAAQSAVGARVSLLRAAERVDVAWSPLLADIATGMPPGTTLKSLSFSDTAVGSSSASGAPSSSPSASTSSSGAAGTLGTLTMTVQAHGDEDQVAVWLRALSSVRGLSTVWVPSATASSGSVTFTSTASLTPQVPMVARTDTTAGAKP